MLLNPLSRRVREHQGFPILPGVFPLVGHLPAVVLNLPDLLRQAERKLGSHFWLDFGFSGLELVCLHPDAFSLLKNKVTTSDVIGELAGELLSNTVLTQDGTPHRNMRSFMNGPFQPRGLSAAEVGPLFAGMIERKMKAWHAQREICLLQETRELVLSLMFRLLGIEETDFSLWRKKYALYVLLAIAPPFDFPGMLRPRGRRARAWIDERLSGFIREARAQPGAGGLLPALVRSFDESDDMLLESHLVANLRLLILGGHESTAATMVWIVIELAQRPEVWDALCDEANAVGAVPQTPQDLVKFPYAEALFRETLRCHPAVALTRRRALVDFTLGGRTIQANTNFTVPIIHLSRHLDLYERPDEFMLERWLGRNESVKPIEMVQFGGGPHVCLGYHMTWLEIVQFAVTLALTMNAGGLRPRLLTNTLSGRRYFPLAHPPAATRVVFA